MKILIFFIILLISLIYIKYDLKYNTNYQILQLSSDKINQDILYEKLPIIIEDKINNILDFIHVILSYEYIHKNKIKFNSLNKINQNLSNYLIMYNHNNKPINIYLSHPKNKNKFKWNSNNSNNLLVSNYEIKNINNINDTQFIKIMLKPKQTIILPKFWLFIIQQNIALYSLFGILNYIIAYLLVLTSK